MIKLGLMLLLLLPVTGFAQSSSRETQKGFFSLGFSYGQAGSRFLNTDGSFADYKSSTFGIDIDVLVWDANIGDIRIFGNHTLENGKNTKLTSDTLSAAESIVGLKVFAGQNLYLSGGWGRGQSKLKSPSIDVDMSLSYTMIRAALGVEFALSDSVFMGLEAAYKSGPIRKDQNESLVENSFIEGFGGSIRLIWSPPSITNITVSNKK